MRLFTGIELGDAARADAAAIITELRRRVDARAPRARITWVAAERLHLTVRFIGEAQDALAERIIGALREPLRVPPFGLTFEGLGAFPPKGPARVFWIGVADGREATAAVERLISERLPAVGVPRDDRAYSPHLTLARVRDAAGLRAKELFEGLSPRVSPTRVDAITLFQSKLSPKGPAYVVLERTPLRDG